MRSQYVPKRRAVQIGQSLRNKQFNICGACSIGYSSVENTVVVAGGGDITDLLQAAHDLRCDSLLTGTH